MLVEGPMYRPPSEARSFLLQATVGCSWNHCTYCDMYRHKRFRVRPLEETLGAIEEARAQAGGAIDKVFVADGDALAMPTDHWLAILEACRQAFPRLRRVSCYATAMNLNEKPEADLQALREAGLALLYVGPETGDDVTFKRIAKGADFAQHAAAARRAHAAGMRLSTIFLLGAGGVERSAEHAAASARLITEMDPAFVSLLTVTVIPGTPLGTLAERGRFEVPALPGLLTEIRTIVAEAAPTDAVFRSNHASNYLPLSGRLPRDRDRLLATLDAAEAGEVALRPEWARGL